MRQFTQRFAERIQGVLSGWDRLRFRGTFRILAHVKGMMYYLHHRKVLLKDFGNFAEATSSQLKESVEQQTEQLGQSIQYVASSTVNKEQLVRQILDTRGSDPGLVCVLSCVEPCQTYDIYRDRSRKMIELVSRRRKCLHYYHYLVDPKFGLVHVRTQTWFPFTVHLCLNGREWLARQMDAQRMGYLRSDNCFLSLDNPPAAQRLMNRQLRTPWPYHLNRLARGVQPPRRQLFADFPLEYYWSIDESEWATDVMFRSPQLLQQLYPELIQHAIGHLGSLDVMRFLGQPTALTSGHYGRFQGQVVTDLRRRPEGVRIRHRVKHNSIKMYDKCGQVLRIETTINQPRDMQVYRDKEGDSPGTKRWRVLRKGIADAHRRAQLSQQANTRYLESLAQVSLPRSLGQLLQPITRRGTWNQQPVRALRPFDPQDNLLLQSIARGEFLLTGFRNRDLLSLLYAQQHPTDQRTRKSQAAAVTRKLRMLRAHGIIQKISKTHRYQLTQFGQALTTALQAAQKADIAKLTAAA